MIANTVLSEKLQKYHDEIWPLTIYEENSNTRHWEYPWIMDQIEQYRGNRDFKQLTMIEMGGSNACLQFYCSLKGAQYTNVERSEDLCDVEIAKKLEAHIKYIYGKFEDIDIDPESYDIVICASILEHTDLGHEESIVKNIAKCLRPGGIAIFTVDWFFDVKIGESCKWGHNINCKEIIDFGQKFGLKLEIGETQYLSGYPEFVEKPIKKNILIPKVCNGGVWVTSQAFVLKKEAI